MTPRGSGGEKVDMVSERGCFVPECLVENGFPSGSGWYTVVVRRHHPRTSTSQSINHALDIRSVHFSIFEYSRNPRKIHGRKIKKKVEVELPRKSFKNNGFDGFGRRSHSDC